MLVESVQEVVVCLPVDVPMLDQRVTLVGGGLHPEPEGAEHDVSTLGLVVSDSSDSVKVR
ncbi:hypothetical protein MUK72_14375 (plasmid) [Halococcus dombrowskii]|uniref:Uncharacterized protein n=1 Tax=Halococcus dombrowskii TaxID=179637 RepID=A0AAV3SBW1_HALDO|nr:hypothetical protein [Halococcus dombrowskii]UOO96902.1 hypothetical protein MUK72_14375 [Halococcus dombrowskii]